MAAPRVILFPGMGCDERLFGPQREGGLEIETPPMPAAEAAENLAAYAARIARSLEIDQTCVVGGVSFGGMLACQIGSLVHPRCVLLIASCRGNTAIPRAFWPLSWLSHLCPDWFIRRRGQASCRLLARLESLTGYQSRLIRDMSLSVPVPHLRRIGRMILQWNGDPPPTCPVHHIHGARDRIIPLRKVKPDVVISDGGHMINLTHADRVNEFIARHVADAGDASRRR
ncbi:MAG TPA: alpha/beta hydrolase [Phycisphaerae bacterium]|nr:alpha/beta hydrolase [Phycisphaerae bacterium]